MQSTDRVRLAFVGCGAITRIEQLPAALRSPRVEVVALVDQRVENAVALDRMFGLNVRTTGNLAEVLDDVQGCVLATPNDTHYPIARQILERGKPVLIEKPITTRYDHALELCKLAESRGTFISVGYRFRFFPSARLLKKLLEENYFGRVLSFHCEMGSAGGWAPVSGYNMDRARSGGGVLVINGTHFLDLAMFWFGEPVSHLYQDDNYGNVEANCKGVWSYDGPRGRFDGTFFFSKTIKLSNRFVIETERGRVEWSVLDAERIQLSDRNRPDVKFELSPRRSTGAVDSFRDQIEEFCANALRPGTVTSDGPNGARSIRLIEDMYRDATRLEEAWQPRHAR
ncbi:MAG TPA: Gfo/Idh/MocA family oxidoreductase [Candidatus Krumholzibacteria bacterium]